MNSRIYPPVAICRAIFGTNADLEKMVDTSDEWIVTRSGIRERRLLLQQMKLSQQWDVKQLKALRNGQS